MPFKWFRATQAQDQPLDIVDAHHHLWDLEANAAGYPWLAPDEHDRGWGDTSALKKTYSVDRLLGDAAAAGVNLTKSVHIQANFDPTRPVDETRWLQALGGDPAHRGLPSAIVGFANLADPGLEAVLEGHCQSSRFRGVRHVLNRHSNPVHNRAPQNWMLDPAWRSGFATLARFGLSFDAQIYHHQADDLIRLAGECPDVPVVIDHTLLPIEREPDDLTAWRAAVRRLAEVPQIMIKASGFGMVERDWTAGSIRPFVRHCIDCFGPDRVMFGSNFPVDMLMANYAKIWSALDEITADLSGDERKALFCGTAERFYRI